MKRQLFWAGNSFGTTMKTCLLVVLYGLLFCTEVLAQTKWVWVVTATDMSTYYVSQIQHLKDGSIRAWAKEIPAHSGNDLIAMARYKALITVPFDTDFYVALFQADPNSTPESDSAKFSKAIKNTLDFMEWDTVQRRARALQVENHYFDGHSDSTAGDEPSAWGFITPDAVSERIYDYVCRH
jgi:hypothetical protein